MQRDACIYTLTPHRVFLDSVRLPSELVLPENAVVRQAIREQLLAECRGLV